MKFKECLVIAALVLAVWGLSANNSSLQAKYENDILTYETLVAGDTLPQQAKMEVVQFQMGEIDLMMSGNPLLAGLQEAKSVCPSTSDHMDQLLSTAFKYLGVRYRSGSSSPSGFDCSGFTRYVFSQHNIELTHSSQAQYNEGTHVNDIAELKKGDLVFFGGSSRRVRSIGHVGIVTEVNPETRSFKFIHASTSKGIKVDSSLDPYYTRRYVGACRVVE